MIFKNLIIYSSDLSYTLTHSQRMVSYHVMAKHKLTSASAHFPVAGMIQTTVQACSGE